MKNLTGSESDISVVNSTGKDLQPFKTNDIWTEGFYHNTIQTKESDSEFPESSKTTVSLLSNLALDLKNSVGGPSPLLILDMGGGSF